ncbi:type II toxin-antitoxin system RelE/ParE family toxin [Methylomonas sp. LL1]|uniref:type II toxin-antitoxin system RelE/ParE family toxin n=1 Tax=Methylomonas sp. LL1 TaxID=2785785 RepID=UPI0018C4262E|nr:type II toxin-antitoxin system RelE/ParE family toxin [Methylomonas sp. LL1]QPK61786.1 type II toxin-antitoxin system RelE/ParE family toxin [Methylomonas sp. LL1]
MTRRRFAMPCSFSSRKTARRYGFQGLLNLHSLALRFQGFAAIAEGYYYFRQGSHLIFYVLNPLGIDIIGIPHQSMDFAAYFDQ